MWGKQRYLKIKHKLFLILFLGAFMVSTLSWIAVNLSFKIYDGQIYREAAEKSYLYMRDIEEKLKKIEQLSFTISSDPAIQQYLKLIKQIPDSYDSIKAAKNLQEKLMVYPFYQDYITSIELIDTFDRQHGTGRKPYQFNSDRLQEIKQIASRNEGANIWGEPMDPVEGVLSIREIREISNLSLDPLGVLVIRLNPDKLSSFAEYGEESEILLLSGSNLLFSRKKHGKSLDFLPLEGRQGYKIENVDGNNYLIAYATFDYTGWTFVNLIAYDSIFQKISIMKSIMIFFFIIIFLSILFITMKFAKSITKPIENLQKKIKIVEQGQFVVDAQEEVNSRDEIGHFSRNFDKMIGKIDSLIKENYVKQLMLKEAEYEALRAKMNPHFLYNTLDSINWLAKRKGDMEISRIVKALGDLLRSTLQNKEFITIDEEISLLENYISIQKFRYEERLECNIRVQEQMGSFLIPSLILQPIVENAIRYGVEGGDGRCRIVITAEEINGLLIISVSDTGPGMDPDYLIKLSTGEINPRGSGIGLRNINDRIQMIYGHHYGIQIDSGSDGGTVIQVHLPIGKTEVIC